MFRPLIILLLLLPSHLEAGKPGDIILKKLNEIVIPIIDFEDTSLEEAIDYLRVRSIELDKDEPSEFRGVSILIRNARKKAGQDDGLGVRDGARHARIKRYQAKNITLTAALIEVGKRTKHDVYITSVGIIICPLDQQPFPNSKGRKGEILKKLTPGPTPDKK